MTGRSKTRAPLRVTLGRSVGLSVTLIALHLAAVASLTAVAIDRALMVTGAMGLLAAMLWQLRLHGLRSHPRSVTGLEMSGEGWFLRLHSGRRVGPMILIRGRCDNALIQLELGGDGRRWHVLAPSDAMPACEFARLRAGLSAVRAGDE